MSIPKSKHIEPQSTDPQKKSQERTQKIRKRGGHFAEKGGERSRHLPLAKHCPRHPRKKIPKHHRQRSTKGYKRNSRNDLMFYPQGVSSLKTRRQPIQQSLKMSTGVRGERHRSEHAKKSISRIREQLPGRKKRCQHRPHKNVSTIPYTKKRDKSGLPRVNKKKVHSEKLKGGRNLLTKHHTAKKRRTEGSTKENSPQGGHRNE